MHAYWSGFCTALAAVALIIAVGFVPETFGRSLVGAIAGVTAFMAAAFSHDAKRTAGHD